MGGQDYRVLPTAAKEMIFAGLASALRQPTPRDQISGALALVLGLTGIHPAGITLAASFEPATKDRLDAIFDECADAVLDVLARHDSTIRETRA